MSPNNPNPSHTDVIDQTLSTIGINACTKQVSAPNLIRALSSCQRLKEHQRKSALTMHQLMCTLFWQLLDLEVQKIDPAMQTRVKVDLSQAKSALFKSHDLIPHVQKMIQFRSLDANPMASLMGQKMTPQTVALLQTVLSSFYLSVTPDSDLSDTPSPTPPAAPQSCAALSSESAHTPAARSTKP